MHLDDAESELLKKWIIKKLEDISDADSDVLADYVLALVKTDDSKPVAKQTCVDNLKDFLLDNAAKFVDELFLAISTKSFDPNKPPPKPAAPVYSPPKRQSFEAPRQPNESRKRSYHDWDRDEQAHASPHQNGDWPMKYARRGGKGHDMRGGRSGPLATPPYGMSQHPSIPQLPTPPPGMPRLDPNTMATLLAMQQAMGFFAGMPNGTSPSNVDSFRPPPRTGQRCRDYDLKGYCAAGVSCPYEHGDDPYVVPRSGQEYDPNNSVLLDVAPARVGHINTSVSDRGRARGRGRGRGRGGGDNWRGGGKRSDFAQTGPNRDKSITSIVVEQIPQDKCDEQSIRDFFSEFGNIEEVIVYPEKKLAIVKYDRFDAALSAYESPKVVFDNRFVKIYWYKPEKMSELSNGPVSTETIKHELEDADMGGTEEIDLEEITRRQDEAQRKHEEAKKQREEAARQKQDVDIKLKAMDTERKKIADLIAKKTGSAISPTAEPTMEDTPEESEKTKALKAQLAELQAEASSLGLDPEAATNGNGDYPSYRGRGAYRARGRGRGRGFYPSYRGGWAGGGARGGAVKRLDNRPKTVAITFAEGSYDTHDEALRQFLLFNNLDSAQLAKHPDRDDSALITFNERYEGENFMMAAGNSKLLHIGKVEFSWYKPNDKTITTNGTTENDVKMQIAETEEQLHSHVHEADTNEMAEDEDLDRWS